VASEKPVVWIGSSLEDLREFPELPRREVGFAISEAQLGRKHPKAKPLKGFGGASTLEIVQDYDGDTYRAVYTVKFGNTIYVLHCFQKKSKSGISTPKRDTDLIMRRYKTAERRHLGVEYDMSNNIDESERVTMGSGNIFADLGFDNPEEELAKARLVGRLAQTIRDQHLTQKSAAKVLGLDQPSVSKLLRGHTAGYSTDRLIHLLNLMDQDVEITVRAKPPGLSRAARVTVTANFDTLAL
jgi:phage-related protein/predicted XRE-type DNA-binding protein